MLESGIILENPVRSFVAAVSAGIVDGEMVLDLDYSEDSRAEVDLNVAFNAEGHIVETQGTAERKPFSVDELGLLLELARDGVMGLIRMQKQILGE